MDPLCFIRFPCTVPQILSPTTKALVWILRKNLQSVLQHQHEKATCFFSSKIKHKKKEKFFKK